MRSCVGRAHHEDDVRAKLRRANVQNYDQVLVVVLEATGDISVVHGDAELDLGIFRNVSDSDISLPRRRVRAVDASTSMAGSGLTQDRLGNGDPLGVLEEAL